jgi:ketol-acid reductoisomerase
MAKVFYDKDVGLEPLKERKVAIIGYGAQGHAQALNLKDSGVNIYVAELEGSPGWKRALSDGIEPVPTPVAVKECTYLQLLVADNDQPHVYKEQIAPYLKEGDVLGFSHGFNIHYAQIKSPPFVDVVMVAPKGPGTLLRTLYQEGRGIPALVAVHQDVSGQALSLALAYAKGIGCTRAGAILTTFAEETETDLFGEQVVLCGGVTSLIKAAFQTLVDAGYQKEVAYFECLHELKLIVDLIYSKGISGMRECISDTAEYGDMTRGPYIIDESVRERMRKVLSQIQSGEFAREWIMENATGRPVYNRLKEKERASLIEETGRLLRSMMPWL